MLYSTPGLTLDDLRVIEDIEAFRSEFRHRLALTRTFRGLRHERRHDATARSTGTHGHVRPGELDNGPAWTIGSLLSGVVP